MIRQLDYRLVGFDAGDGTRNSVILDVDKFAMTIERSNIYRIDGEISKSDVTAFKCPPMCSVFDCS